MCAPVVMSSVHEGLSRRRFLGAVAGCAASAAAVNAQPGRVRLAKGFQSIVDLTHPYSPALPVYPGYNPVRIRPRFSIARNGFAANEVTFDEHTGTHVDAPSHFVADGVPADRIPADSLVAPLVVISIAARAAKDADALVSVDDLLQWEKRYGRVPPGALVAMYSGWEARIGAADGFLNRDAKGTMHAPGFGEPAARFLVTERIVCGLGVDTLSLDAAAAQEFVAHLAVLGAGKYGVELMANLSRVPPSGATVVIGAPRHLGATGGPARVLALV